MKSSHGVLIPGQHDLIFNWSNWGFNLIWYIYIGAEIKFILSPKMSSPEDDVGVYIVLKELGMSFGSKKNHEAGEWYGKWFMIYVHKQLSITRFGTCPL